MTKSLTRCFLDSNVLVSYKVGSSIFYPQAISIITSLTRHDSQLFISPLVIDEFIHSLIRTYRISRIRFTIKEIRNALDEVITLPLVSIINPPTDIQSQLMVIDYMKEFNLRPRDAYHLLTMKANGIDSFATFDRDFQRIFKKGVIKEFK